MEKNDRFFNAYVDLAVGTLHQNVNTILELKTQIKLFEDLVREKDQVISNLDAAIGLLNQKIENFEKEKGSLSKQFEETARNLTSQYDQRLSDIQSQKQRLESKIDSLEREKEASLKKSGHMATFENQIKTMKREILEKNAEIESLKKSLVASSNTSNTSVASVINTKTKRPQSKPDNVDDF